MIALCQLGSHPGAKDEGCLPLSHMGWRQKGGCIESSSSVRKAKRSEEVYQLESQMDRNGIFKQEFNKDLIKRSKAKAKCFF